MACGSCRKPKTPAPVKATPVKSTNFSLRDPYSLPSGGWPLKIGEKIEKVYSIQDAVARSRAKGQASSIDLVTDNICRQLIAQGRGSLCKGIGSQVQSKFLAEDQQIDLTLPRGLTEGATYADAYGWGRLHKRALIGRLTPEYLEFFSTVIGCWRCQQHWTSQIKALPPDWVRAFEWSVRIHNAVNVSTGKPEVTVEAAREFWT